MMTILLGMAAAVATPVAPPAAPPGGIGNVARLKALGMSDAGVKVLRAQSVADPDARAVAAKRQAIRQQLATAAAANPFDIDAFAALLRESSLLEATARGRSEERIVTTLKALPAADRSIFARAIFAGPPARPAEGNAPAARPQP